ncbi:MULTISPECIES: hypothetical protein [unclassified Nocardioides]|uniref:hypothetical protein n=1 Tax=unclassified Nocardioides TaxID=2615069 RepID=UPI0007011193|nr:MULTISPECIES: hypothetical protein [unclassified Nocardioides]KQY57421.1 hypothetical protein ASD30_14565 [Nocardioides sp. Root140]KRF20386.1 hypothetical protein ASH02_22000 [Nocardioides sp. Soil796]
MTDPELTPAQNEAVRRLLADARHDEPMPAEVAARLDDVLADLSGERATSPEATSPEAASSDVTSDADGAVVVPLAERRERKARRWPAVLLSAAAVAAIGLGVTQMLDSSPDGDNGSAESRSADDGAAKDSLQGEDAPSSSDSATEEPPTTARLPQNLDDLESELTSELGPVTFRDGQAYKADVTPRETATLTRRCGPDKAVPGAWLQPATYRGRDALVIFHPPSPTGRRVDLYVCGPKSGRYVDSVTLPSGE